MILDDHRRSYVIIDDNSGTTCYGDYNKMNIYTSYLTIDWLSRFFFAKHNQTKNWIVGVYHLEEVK